MATKKKSGKKQEAAPAQAAATAPLADVPVTGPTGPEAGTGSEVATHATPPNDGGTAPAQAAEAPAPKAAKAGGKQKAKPKSPPSKAPGKKPAEKKSPAKTPASTPSEPKPRKGGFRKNTGSRGLSALDAAVKVLGETGKEMSCGELVERMMAKGYWNSSGKTPAATLYTAWTMLAKAG